jgi:hypothetical protein
MICAAIDPGQSGGLAYINLDSGQVFTQKMPETTKDICLALSDFKRRNAFIILEAQHARPSGIIHRKNPRIGSLLDVCAALRRAERASGSSRNPIRRNEAERLDESFWYPPQR